MSILIRSQYAKCMDVNNLPGTIDYWGQVSCPDVISAYLTLPDGNLTSQTSKLAYVPERMAEVQAATDVLMRSFDMNQAYGFSADSGAPDFVETLIAYCRSDKTPGACDTFLQGYCGDLTLDDRARVSADPFLTAVCGCYIPPDPAILPYSNGSVTNPVACATEPNPGAACDALCRPSTTIKRSCQASGELFLCPQNVCVIDQVSVNSSRSRTGDVNLNTICAGCETGCVCITEVDASDEALNVNINQVCGDASVCFQRTGDTAEPVTCQSYPPAGAEANTVKGSANVGYLPLGMLIFLVVVVGLLVLLALVT